MRVITRSWSIDDWSEAMEVELFLCGGVVGVHIHHFPGTSYAQITGLRSVRFVIHLPK